MSRNIRVDIIEEGRTVLKILTHTPTEKGPLGRPRRRWEDSIKMDLRNRYQYEELGWFGSG